MSVNSKVFMLNVSASLIFQDRKKSVRATSAFINAYSYTTRCLVILLLSSKCNRLRIPLFVFLIMFEV
jgi:hypothetical protein